jgi:plastocyanin
MSKKKVIFLILFSFELAVIIPLAIGLMPVEVRNKHITINVRKYGYSPSRLVVNKGDTVFLKLFTLDVTHGLLLDGYPIELIARKGVTFQKHGHKGSSDKLKTDWNRVSQVKFVASKPGKFTFRCTETCGNLHPFMTGELVVKPNTPYHLFVSLSLWVVFSIFVLMKGKDLARITGSRRINLSVTFPKLKSLVNLRSFQFLIIFPNFIVFYLFVLSSLGGSPVGNRNIAIVFVWILWWFILKAVMVPLGGRIWCLMCPLPAPAEWLSRKRLSAVKYIEKPFKRLHHRFMGLQKDWPRKLRNIWLQNFLFLALISFGMILITRPVATAFLFLFILVITLGLTMIYRNRVFCQFLCPVGGFLGTYSMASMTEVRAIDPKVCKNHKEKSCYTGGPNGWACPWNQYVGNMRRLDHSARTVCLRAMTKCSM